MAAFGAQVVPGSTDWLARPSTRCGDGSARILSDNSQTMEAVSDSPPAASYQLDYKYNMTSFVYVKPDPDEEFITDRQRVMTSQYDYNSLVGSSGRARLLIDEYRQQQRDWPMATSYHDNDAGAGGLQLPDELVVKYRRRLLPEELVDASFVDHRLPPPSWNHVTNSSPPEVTATGRPPAKYPQFDREVAYDMLQQQQQSVISRYQRNGRHGDQVLPPALDIVKEDSERVDENTATYHPRRLMYAGDKDKRQLHVQNSRAEMKLPPGGVERRHSPPELSRRSVCSDQLSSSRSDADMSQADYNYERRQTWPMDSPFLPSWRRKINHGDASFLPEVGGGGATLAKPSSDPALQLQQPAPAAAGGQDGRSPISELMQMYDVAMTSHMIKRQQPSVQMAKPSVVDEPEATTSPPRHSTATSGSGGLKDTSKSSGMKQFSCHICPYIGDKKFDFDAHMRLHFDHWCPYCNYSSRTEGRLRCHIKMFHSSRDPTGTNGDLTNKKRPKSKIACRHCDFSTKIKEELWMHMRQHIPAEKMLECPRCTFVTDLKHHLEYHLRSSHIGSKPYKCDKCTYRCFNQSMLNSHAKSHTNVYQFRCRDCPFAAKYCHALKVHIRRYGHEAAPVLNEDGSQPADGSGDFALISRRGRPRGLRGAQGDLPRFRSVRSRQNAEAGSNPKPSLPPAAVDFIDPKVAPSVNIPGNHGFPEIEKMFFGQRPADHVLDHAEAGGALPPFAKFAGKAGLPQLYTPEMAVAVSNMTSYPECRDVTLAPTSPPTHYQQSAPPPPPFSSSMRSQQSDVVMDEPSRCFMKTHPRSGFYDDERMFQIGGQSVTLHQRVSPPQSYNYVDDENGSRSVPEPERGQCGDLPLDLTLSAGRQKDDDLLESEQTDDCSRQMMGMSRKRPFSPDDEDGDDELDGQLFRRRRHFREWFKLQQQLLRDDEQSTSNDGLAIDPEKMILEQRKLAAVDAIPDGSKACAKIEPLRRTSQDCSSHSDATQTGTIPVELNPEDVVLNQDGSRHSSRASPVIDAVSPKAISGRSRSNSQGSSDEALTGSGSEAAAAGGWVATGRYQCVHCEIDFHGSRALHAMHMSYHSNADPFRCNVCGEPTEDRVAFFEHLARVAHN